MINAHKFTVYDINIGRVVPPSACLKTLHTLLYFILETRLGLLFTILDAKFFKEGVRPAVDSIALLMLLLCSKESSECI
jgi:hypothetical protein